MSVQADPAEIRIFANELARFGQILDQELSGLRARFDRLGDSWGDAEHSKFEREFTDLAQALSTFTPKVQDYVGYLNRKAEPLEEYLGR